MLCLSRNYRNTCYVQRVEIGTQHNVITYANITLLVVNASLIIHTNIYELNVHLSINMFFSLIQYKYVLKCYVLNERKYWYYELEIFRPSSNYSPLWISDFVINSYLALNPWKLLSLLDTNVNWVSLFTSIGAGNRLPQNSLMVLYCLPFREISSFSLNSRWSEVLRHL